MFALPIGQIALLLLALLIYLGVIERVLDRMRMTDRTALIIIGLMLIGSFLPSISLGPIGVNIGGAIIPIAICLYLLITADKSREKLRAIGASIAATIGILIYDKVLPVDPGGFIYDIDPLFVPAIIAGAVAYALGRSRRASFIAGVFGVVLSDLAAATENMLRGAAGVGIVIGGAGLLDAVLVAGTLAVVLAEVTGEIAERLSRKANHERPQLIKRILERSELTSAAGVGGKGKTAFLWAVTTIVISLLLIIGGHTLISIIGQTDELEPGTYMTLVDEYDQVITMTGRRVFVGDQFISQDNRLYQVEKIEDNMARVVFVEQVDLLSHLREQISQEQAQANYAQTGLVERIFYFGRRVDQDGPEDRRRAGAPLGRVAIFHTHNAESFIPTDGTDSIYGKGGIHKVGATFKDSLGEHNIEVVYSENLHLPHDRGAYRRSRRTVTNLIQEDPDIIFDVHRDAAPPHVYAENIEDTWVTQIMLVVGRQNQNRNANMSFARELKAIADETTPGLIRGIFIARGNYNQDLFTRKLLLEVGAHTNARESAQRGIELFAPIVGIYLERQAEEERRIQEEETREIPEEGGEGTPAEEAGGEGADEEPGAEQEDEAGAAEAPPE